MIFFFPDTNELDFDNFAEIAARYLPEEENPEALQQELREAFRLYDKEGGHDQNKLS